jgi:hypothetical protein
MDTFDPSQPAILHDCIEDRIITWTGGPEELRSFRDQAVWNDQEHRLVSWNGMLLDGWGNVLGG